MKLKTAFLVLPSVVSGEMMSEGYRGYGLIGHGISMYYPTCAYACYGILKGYQLKCSDGPTTSPECYTTDDNFLQSLAYCIHTHCAGVPISDIEAYWAAYIPGRLPGQPSPKEPYSVALLHADPPPDRVIESGELLNTTTLVDEDQYLAAYNSNSYYEQMEARQSDFGLVALATGAVIPILLSLLRFVPFPKTIVSRFYAYVIDPPLFCHRHREPVLGLFIMPTRGQALFIAYFIILNVVLSCVDYRLVIPNFWFPSEHDQLVFYIANRTAVLAFANLPLLVLYSSRNNFLLWLTNWSHTTFLLIHRWIAIICTLEACVHSLVYLRIYVARGEYEYASAFEYWKWGIAATVVMCAILLSSILPLRQKLYELFLATHFVLALLALLACYHHIYFRYENQWGYETWIYVAFGVWAFDRVARVARMARNGVRTAYVTVLDDDYVRVDVPGLAVAYGHAYLYFPTLTWRVWENHPFSVMATPAPSLAPSISVVAADEKPKFNASSTSSSSPELAPAVIPEPFPSYPEPTKSYPEVSSSSSSSSSSSPSSYTPGLTFFIRTETGLTASLRKLCPGSASPSAPAPVAVLVEASYGTSSLLEQLRTAPAQKCVAIAGGAGIAGVAPLLRRALAAPRDGDTVAGPARARLFWGVRSPALARSALGASGVAAVHAAGGEVAVGRRLDLRAILEREVPVGPSPAAPEHEHVTVVVCGPDPMADEVRELVRERALRGASVRLLDEAYSW
ncbi:ferric reductase like transmembrane component-domain-containing protein [Durotheca rogersii]|uniref:ferric reductase like transmembrane component-domain-containing protein n=1 Tax=Durotheca rogersii TaxID=419775 RepID=UPI002220FCC8|nr:ferric reductase like transmembrane component-domain-containing protein [Durotheca rogersii]KAI5867218.1 ferric reductase like transmembrane component-domain-containing protein [Durotheca rogersii]